MQDGLDLVGQRLGDFEVIERLKAGGMAMLYLGRKHGASGFTRKVALKVVHPHLAVDERFVRMFVDEARICSQMTHPNLVHVEELGVDRGLHYLAMEYIDGCSLRAVFKYLSRADCGLSVPIATRIVMDVAAGLHAAHLAVGEDGVLLDIIHRDISPTNILLSRAGHVKLIDFGIAKARNRLIETEAQYSVKGKLKYMAPEQALSGTVDPRCDLFALGVVLWEALAGRELFRGAHDKLDFLQQLHGTAIAAPSSVNPAVSPALDALVAKVLAFDACDRCASAGELRQALAELVPDALAIDASDLAALVAAATGETIATPVQPTAPTEIDAGVAVVVAAAPRRSRARWMLPVVVVLLAWVGASRLWTDEQHPALPLPDLATIGQRARPMPVTPTPILVRPAITRAPVIKRVSRPHLSRAIRQTPKRLGAIPVAESFGD